LRKQNCEQIVSTPLFFPSAYFHLCHPPTLRRGAALTAQRLAAAIQSEEDERARRVAALHAIRDESISGSVARGDGWTVQAASQISHPWQPKKAKKQRNIFKISLRIVQGFRTHKTKHFCPVSSNNFHHVFENKCGKCCLHSLYF
jgi:hypothetical protein